MNKKLRPRIYKGTRDFLPEQMVKRQYIIEIIKKSFEKFGFEPLETPTLELWETLAGKYGDEGDRLTYRFTDRGEREVGLRYDLTVPLSRVIAMYPEIPKPFKRYQIQPVWRADKPQKGRFREFYQCDIDVVGSRSMLAEAEILTPIYEILRQLGFDNFTIRINSRKILQAIAEVAGLSAMQEIEMARCIDKLDKIGIEGVQQELMNSGINSVQMAKILTALSISGSNSEKIEQTAKFIKASQSGQAGIAELRSLLDYLRLYQIPENYLMFDLFLARGLDYYTGPIFETVVQKPQIGSVTGGGRYDRLIGLFSGTDQPATGCSIGLERIITVMDELAMFPTHLKASVKILVTVFDSDSIPYSIRIAGMLRQAGFSTELYSGESKLRGQFGLANDKSIPVVIIAGPDEREKQQVTLKNMISGTQKTVGIDQLIGIVTEEIK